MPPDSGSTRSSRRSVSCTNSSSSSRALADHRARQVEVAAVDEEVVAHRELGVEVVLLRHHAEPGADLRAVGRRVQAEHAQVAARRAATRSRSCASSRSCPRRSGPRKPNASPGSTRKSMPSTATKAPNRLVSSRPSISADTTENLSALVAAPAQIRPASQCASPVTVTRSTAPLGGVDWYCGYFAASVSIAAACPVPPTTTSATPSSRTHQRLVQSSS